MKLSWNPARKVDWRRITGTARASWNRARAFTAARLLALRRWSGRLSLRGLGARVRPALAAAGARLQGTLRAVWRWRPSARAWTVVAAAVTVPIGALLTVTPVRELASGRSAGLEEIVTFAWLCTGAATLVGGLGILCRAPSFRRALRLAFLTSLALPAAFGWRTADLLQKWWAAEQPAAQQKLEPWVWGGLQVTLLFLGLSVFLWFLPRLRPLRTLQCTGSLVAGPIGQVVGPGIGAAIGAGAGFALWRVCRWLGAVQDLAFFERVVRAVRVEAFVVTGAALGAAPFLFAVVRRLRNRARNRPRPAPAAQGP